MSAIYKVLVSFLFLTLLLIFFHTQINSYMAIVHISDVYTTQIPGGDIDRHPFYYVLLKFFIEASRIFTKTLNIKIIFSIFQSIFQSAFFIVIYAFLRSLRFSKAYSVGGTILFFFSSVVIPTLFLTLEDNVTYYPFLLLFFHFLIMARPISLMKNENFYILVQSILLFLCLSINISLLIFSFIIFLTPVFLYLKDYKQAKRMFFIPFLAFCIFHTFHYISYPAYTHSPFIHYLNKALSFYDGMATAPGVNITPNIITFFPKAIFGFTNSFIGHINFFELDSIYVLLYVVFFFFIYKLLRLIYSADRIHRDYSRSIIISFLFCLVFIYSHVFEAFIIERWDFYPLLIFVVFINSKEDLLKHKEILVLPLLLLCFGLYNIKSYYHVIKYQSAQTLKILNINNVQVNTPYECLLIKDINDNRTISSILGHINFIKLPSVYLQDKDRTFRINTHYFVASESALLDEKSLSKCVIVK